MRRMSTDDAELIFRQLRKCNSDEEFRCLISSLRDGNIVKPESYDDYIKHESILKHLQDNMVNILLTGPVGTGKSATVNAILKKDAVVVGRGLCPATTDIKSYSNGNIVIWDTPGLGNDRQSDKKISDNIINLLRRKQHNGKYLIDIVIIILNAVSCDYMVMSELFNNILIPYMGEDIKSRVIVGLNQCDILMHRDYWERWNSSPYGELVAYMSDKEKYVETLIHNTICTGMSDTENVNIKAVCYSAGYKEAGEKQKRSYNIDRLMSSVAENINA